MIRCLVSCASPSGFGLVLGENIPIVTWVNVKACFKYMSLCGKRKRCGDLKILAQKAFGKGFLKLVTSQGHALVDLTRRSSRWLCGYMGQPTLWWWQLQSPRPAKRCAPGPGHGWRLRCLEDGSFVTWGDPEFGGESFAVEDEFAFVERCFLGFHILWPCFWML